MFLTKLSFKNLVRHRNRTLITASIIAFAIFYYILFDSLIAGMTEMSYNNIINYEAGHLQLATENYWEEKNDLPLEDLLVAEQEVMSAVRNRPGYIGSSPELNFQARLNNGINELPVIGKGIIPDRFTDVFEMEGQFVDGEIFTDGEYKAVMGKRLADLLKLKIGDYIILLVKDKNETFNTIDVEISGLVHTGNPNVNRNIVYLPLDIVQQALNVENQISKVIIRLENKEMASGIANKLETDLKTINKNLNVYTWSELEAISIAGAKQLGNKIIMTIILIIAAIAIINTVILAALERMNEIGMMKAMGLQVKEIVYTFVLESTGIGLLGGIYGVMMGAVGVWFLSQYGIDFAGLTGIDNAAFGIPVIGKMYGVWNISAFIEVFSFGVIVSLLSSILPGYWAARKDPVKAIYYR